ncbi:nicotinate-nucleotide--dimethylbenzimidazole phosphoribosyltransferase [Hahella sp. CCB-MM4]|uniref:nicotinate-nucleotide--dimethylbenzimidazole phosphoribosyltransferase n=1 Tax=Hahella sp. (strain CCB-MM4) TaxID=1926491 RepID=UPI000B9C34DA|nr:nicotinate-nucleotide--dimethylbenzimidazole phosphoribosyltransferase [Hahella sp. CCB-MM4]OZG74978.1 nicotinate-nucleotide--dimethylbenzimidazole phosphoribosyltransferase [Hahella sp. CCB-MM4]
MNPSDVLPVVPAVSEDWDERLHSTIDHKTKPLGALGLLESLAFQVGRIQGTLRPTLVAPHILVFAADHGLAREGVSAYPQDVTWQMVLNFLEGGAAINVFSRQHGISVRVIDVGVNHDFGDEPGLIQEKVGSGTASMLSGPAMSDEDCVAAIQAGRRQAQAVLNLGANVIGVGEMGIGNTSSASLIMSRLLNIPLEDCVGRGTGLDDERYQRKLSILKQVAELHSGAQAPMEVLAAMGGYEVAAMVGAMLEAAAHGVLVLVDGFIATAAFLVASQLRPELSQYAVFCHCSEEQGHRLMLSRLHAKPLLQLGMRLGEGSGCAVAYPVIESAVAMLTEMASFAEAGVSEKS